jgi:hypothetical protein
MYWYRLQIKWDSKKKNNNINFPVYCCLLQTQQRTSKHVIQIQNVILAITNCTSSYNCLAMCTCCSRVLYWIWMFIPQPPYNTFQFQFQFEQTDCYNNGMRITLFEAIPPWLTDSMKLGPSWSFVLSCSWIFPTIYGGPYPVPDETTPYQFIPFL